MAGKRNAKRIIKKMQRQGSEYKNVVDGCIFMLTQHGFTVSFPWEIPNILEQLLREREGGAPDPAASQQGAADAYNRLAAMSTGQPAPAQPAPTQAPPTAPSYQAPPPAGPPQNPWAVAAGNNGAPAQPAPPPEPVDPWASAASSSLDELLMDDAPAATPSGNGMPLSEVEMRARVEAANARMVQRVETNGATYKHGAGPAIPPTPGAQPSASSANGGAPPPPTDDRPLKHGGLTRGAALDLIERATGRRPGTPEASPVIKPPGF